MRAYKLIPAILAVSLFGASNTSQAGRVVSMTADMPHAPSGFGAWNLDNVTINVPGGSFNPETGAYEMGPGGTYSGIVTDGQGTETAFIGGKSWPIGEPSGIKVVNDDPGVPPNRPPNCLATTSYLEEGFLDAETPVQTMCSSGFQTHKRFKVNMTPGSLDAGVDLVFNIEPDGTTRDYRVLQKINNYTDARLEGFVVQVGVGVGADFVPAGDAGLSAALWVSTPSEIWSDQQIATFSHGLFGEADDHFPEDGFFDNIRAGFTTEIVEYTMGSGLGDTFRSTGTLGSNYAQVPPDVGPPDQFGPWLPSIWEPYGYFFDDDGDPETDAQLMAFWGETAEGSGEYAWMSGDADDFAVVDAKLIEMWNSDPAYEVGPIEDLLNVGLNYLVTVGTVDATWPTWDADTSRATFTLRIQPVEDTSGLGQPGYVDNPPPTEGEGTSTGGDTDGDTDTSGGSDTTGSADTSGGVDTTGGADTSGGGESSSGGDPIGTTGGGDSGVGSTGETDPGQDDGDSGCGCTTDERGSGPALPLLVFGLGFVARRRRRSSSAHR
jgi:uncharacterized protein (TIGR03382 family)